MGWVRVNIGRSGGYRRQFSPTRARSGLHEGAPESVRRTLGRGSVDYRSGTVGYRSGTYAAKDAAGGRRRGGDPDGVGAGVVDVGGGGGHHEAATCGGRHHDGAGLPSNLEHWRTELPPVTTTTKCKLIHTHTQSFGRGRVSTDLHVDHPNLSVNG